MNIDVKGATKRSKWWIDTGSQIPTAPTFAEILKIDREPLPHILEKPGDLHPPPRLIPYDRYIDPKFVDLEVEHIWKKQWQVACREEDIPNVGDRINYDIVDLSFLIVRSGPNEFKAFYNTCRHRGRKLCEAKTNASSIRCAFHGWSYGLDGKLEWVPYEQDFPHVDSKHYSLVPVQVATWGGNIFINPDPKAPPLAQALGPLLDHFKDDPMEERYTFARMIVEIGCNWKAAQEAFMEGYHLLETHTDGLPIYNATATQIDAWSDGLGYVSRLITPGVISDSWIDGKIPPRESLIMYCTAYKLPLPPEDRGLDQADARKYVAEARRKQLEDSTGKPWAQKTTSYYVDQVKYFLFPNHAPFWGEGMPRWMNFKPLGSNPDACQMEVRTLLPMPKDGKRPPVPEPYHIKLGELVTERYPILGQSGVLIDQDLDNMCANQRGFKAAPPSAAFLTLSEYQEMKIRRFHEIYDKVLGLDINE